MEAKRRATIAKWITRRRWRSWSARSSSGSSDAARAEADEHIAIPMHGLGTSLNVSVAVGVILAEAERQRLAAGLYARSRLTAEERERTLFEWSYPDIAERCRQHGRPYPPLTADGTLASNPLIDVLDGQSAGVTRGYSPPFGSSRRALPRALARPPAAPGSARTAS